jgi:hypothetical protein
MRFLMIVAGLSLLCAAPLEARQFQPDFFGPRIPGLATKAQPSQLTKEACRGCGCRGGAGYRLSNGKCAPRRG